MHILERTRTGPLFPIDLNSDKVILFDLSSANKSLTKIDAADTEAFNSFIFDKLLEEEAQVGVGGYLEDRNLYRQSSLFNNGKEEPRSVHLGVDLWAKAGMPVLAPLSGRVHSFQNNNAMLDYGATIILEHEVEGERFWTLYGHLSRDSLNGLVVGQEIEFGQTFAHLGTHEENGGWAPHLHFQIITAIGEWQGDFPGVCKESEVEEWQRRCPNPNLLLHCVLLSRE